MIEMIDLTDVPFDDVDSNGPTDRTRLYTIDQEAIGMIRVAGDAVLVDITEKWISPSYARELAKILLHAANTAEDES